MFNLFGFGKIWHICLFILVDHFYTMDHTRYYFMDLLEKDLNRKTVLLTIKLVLVFLHRGLVKTRTLGVGNRNGVYCYYLLSISTLRFKP